MVWNVLGLFYLVLGITGIVNCHFTQEDWKDRNRGIAEPWNWPSYKEWKNKRYYFNYGHLNDVPTRLDYRSNKGNMLFIPNKLAFNGKPNFEYLLPKHKQLFERILATVSPLVVYTGETLIPDVSNFDKNAISYIQPRNYENEGTSPSTDANEMSLSNTDLSSIFSSAAFGTSHSELNLKLTDEKTSPIMQDSTEPNLEFKRTATALSSVNSQGNVEHIEASESSSLNSNHENKSHASEVSALMEKQENYSTKSSADEDIVTNSATFYSTENSPEKNASELSSNLDNFSNSKTLATDNSSSNMTENLTSNPASVEDISGVSILYSTIYDMEGKSERRHLYTELDSLIEILNISSETSEKESGENTPSNIKSNFSREILSTSSETSEKESMEKTHLNTESSISTDIVATSTQTLEEETQSPNRLSTANLGALVSLTSQVTKDTNKDFSSTASPPESVSVGFKYITKVISQEHVIRIQSIHTARMVISVVFVVVFLIALAILGIYMFRIKRRAVEYDRLLLLS